MLDDERYQSTIDQKCPPCFRKNECMLFSARHAGVELCGGPFKDDDDYDSRVHEEVEKQKKKANLRGYVSEDERDLYRANIDLLKHGSGSSSEDSGDDD